MDVAARTLLYDVPVDLATRAFGIRILDSGHWRHVSLDALPPAARYLVVPAGTPLPEPGDPLRYVCDEDIGWRDNIPDSWPVTLRRVRRTRRVATGAN